MPLERVNEAIGALKELRLAERPSARASTRIRSSGGRWRRVVYGHRIEFMEAAITSKHSGAVDAVCEVSGQLRPHARVAHQGSPTISG